MYEYKNVMTPQLIDNIVSVATELEGGDVTDRTGYYILLTAYEDGTYAGSVAVDVSKITEHGFTVYLDADNDEPFKDIPYGTGFVGTFNDEDTLFDALTVMMNRFKEKYR